MDAHTAAQRHLSYKVHERISGGVRELFTAKAMGIDYFAPAGKWSNDDHKGLTAHGGAQLKTDPTNVSVDDSHPERFSGETDESQELRATHDSLSRGKTL